MEFRRPGCRCLPYSGLFWVISLYDLQNATDGTGGAAAPCKHPLQNPGIHGNAANEKHSNTALRLSRLAPNIDKRAGLLHTTLMCNAHQLGRDGRVDDCAGLENRYTSGYRGFESHSLRHFSILPSPDFFHFSSVLYLEYPSIELQGPSLSPVKRRVVRQSLVHNPVYIMFRRKLARGELHATTFQADCGQGQNPLPTRSILRWHRADPPG